MVTMIVIVVTLRKMLIIFVAVVVAMVVTVILDVTGVLHMMPSQEPIERKLILVVGS